MKHSIKKLIFIFGILIFSQLFFLLPASITTALLYQSIKDIQSEQVESAQQYLTLSKPFLVITNATYTIAVPSLSILHIKTATDSIMIILNRLQSFSTTAVDTEKLTTDILSLVFKKNKSDNEVKQLSSSINNLPPKTTSMSKDLSEIINNLYFPQFQRQKDQLIKLQTILTQFHEIAPKINELFGAQGEKKYVLFFLNNRELRPGGGFIGSFAVLSIKNYEIEDLKVQDVYDADGQLKVHVDAPEGLHYLNIYDLFLRDSNFSPDFADNVQRSRFFLAQEIGLTDIAGAIGITSTAIENILEAYGDVYLPDFNETINKDNFYIKTQNQVENNFFPGSTQKKTYLSSLAKTLLSTISHASKTKLLQAMRQSIQQKQVVLYSSDNQVEKSLQTFGWSGTLPVNSCNDNNTCIQDIVFPVDANVGGNKANYYVTRSMQDLIKMNSDGTINHALKLTYKNDASSTEKIPYKNYVQLYLPLTATIKKVISGSDTISNYAQKEDHGYKVVSFFTEIPAQSTRLTTVEYSLVVPTTKKGIFTYQLILPKQVGAKNEDLELQVTLPTNISLRYANHPSTVSNNKIIFKESHSQDDTYTLLLQK